MSLKKIIIINSLLQSIQVSRANIDTCNFVNCPILPYNTSLFKFNGNASRDGERRWQWCWTRWVSQQDIPDATLNQSLGGEEFKEPILKAMNVFICYLLFVIFLFFFTMICHKGPHVLMSSMIFKLKKTVKIIFEIVKNYIFSWCRLQPLE